MVKRVSPRGSGRAERALAQLGNLGKVSTLRWLRENPLSTKRAVADGLGLEPPTAVKYLQELELAGLLVADPPRESRNRGEWVNYRVNDEAVTELYLTLGQELGEI